MDKIGDIIRSHRSRKSMTQEELGNLLYVSKQAVSKWETGKTMPDLNTIRKLCKILDISNDEILGSSVEDSRRKTKWLKLSTIVTIVSLVVAIFLAFDGIGFINRRVQSGVAYVTVFENNELLESCEYSIDSELKTMDMKNGYSFSISYGEVKGIIKLPGELEIEYGFVNTNNWHNVDIRIDIVKESNEVCVRQTVSYKTDNSNFEVLTTESTGIIGEVISVFRAGV